MRDLGCIACRVPFNCRSFDSRSFDCRSFDCRSFDCRSSDCRSFDCSSLVANCTRRRNLSHLNSETSFVFLREKIVSEFGQSVLRLIMLGSTAMPRFRGTAKASQRRFGTTLRRFCLLRNNKVSQSMVIRCCATGVLATNLLSSPVAVACKQAWRRSQNYTSHQTCGWHFEHAWIRSSNDSAAKIACLFVLESLTVLVYFMCAAQ